MPPRKNDPFAVTRPDDGLHPQFLILRDAPFMGPARGALLDVLDTMEDPDGNLIEQFQTFGFDSRTFEIYLQAMFTEAGHAIDRRHQRPDFLISRDGLTVAVEAVTANLPPRPTYQPYNATYREPPGSPADALRYLRNEVQIRFGSPLYTKLGKQYWRLPHVQGRPFVLAIENFHGDASLSLSSSALSSYLFGLEHGYRLDEHGHVIIEADIIDQHIGSKTIPSNFFGLLNAEHVSAVLFCNAGTIPKFNRIGQEGRHRSTEVRMVRYGTCFDHDPKATEPDTFVYEVGNSNFPTEPWRQGSVMIHNPRALHPVPMEWIGAGSEEHLSQNGTVMPVWRDYFTPYMSQTMYYPGDMSTQTMRQEAEREVRQFVMGQLLAREWSR